MKKLFYSFAMLALVVGCSEDPATNDNTGGGNNNGGGDNTDPTPTEEVITASFEECDLDLAWAEGDAIAVFTSTTNEKWAYNTEANGFKKADNAAAAKPLDYTYGVYPYGSSVAVNTSGEVKNISIADEQDYVAGSFDAAKNLMVAIAEKNSKELTFQNVCGFVTVKVIGNTDVKSIKLQGASKEKLAGGVTVTFADNAPVATFGSMASDAIVLNLAEAVTLQETEDAAQTFTFIVAPATFANGCTVIVTDSEDRMFRTNFEGEITVARNEVKELGVASAVVKASNEVIFDAKFNTDGTATDEGKFAMTIETITDNGKTPNMRVYTHPEFADNNIAQFSFMSHNEGRRHSYFAVDYSENADFKAALADGFTWEIVTSYNVPCYDWWQCPGSSEAFRFYRKCDANNNDWLFNLNSDGAWWPFNAGAAVYATETFAEAMKYQHSVFVYDANTMSVKTYTNGVADGEVLDLAEFKVGNRFAIGGYAEDGFLGMAYNGDVAIFKLYNEPMSAEAVAARYGELTLPEAPIIAEGAAISEPLFDLKWNEDRTATDAGSAALEVNPVLNDLTEIVNVPEVGNIVNFAVKPNDGAWASPDPTVVSNSNYSDGYYRIVYGENEEFKSKLQDGFTLEVICASNFRQGGFWMRPFSTDRWGFMMHDDNYRWKTVANGGENDWGAHGDTERGYPAYTDEAEGAPMKSFTHILYVYNAEGKEYGMFVDGKCNCARPLNGFEVGTMMSVPGMPYTDRLEMAHGWNGKVAAVRIYDEAFTQEQRIKRYNDMKPVIEKLNTVIAQ